MTIHLVYPHKNIISAPNAIGYRLSLALASVAQIVTHEWDFIGKIDPEPGDILIGHPHPFPFTIFRRSLIDSRWSKVIILQPFNLDVKQVGYIDDIIDQCDLFLAITGKYWFDRIERSSLSRWRAKMIHVDLAVDRGSFPKVKNRFNAKGQRKFIYIGNDNPVKNVAFLSVIAQALPEYSFAWAGTGRERIGLNWLGYLDFSTEVGRNLISEYDFMITVGTADANPTTILEAMSWGLVPVCTPTSGYENIPGIVNVPTNDLEGTLSVLRQLQASPEEELLALVARAQEMLISGESPRLQQSPKVQASGRQNVGPFSGGCRMFGHMALNNLKYRLKIDE
jgi:glycosyltransferase involved in cell wall biosynthesis